MASVLETFLILFESNADEVDRGNQHAKQSTDRLNDTLRTTDKLSNVAGESFTEMIRSAAGALTAALSVGAIVSGVFAAATRNDNLNDFTERLDLNIETVSAWGDAVALNGGTAEGFQQTLDGLTEAVNTFAVKGASRVAPFFKELGVDMVDAQGNARDVMDLLPELADAFEGLTKQESSGLGKKIGLDQGTILLLQQGRREVDAQIARQKELGVVTKEAAEIAANFNDAQDDTAKVFRSLFTVIGTSVLPVFTSILRGVQSVGAFLTKHSDFMVGLLIALGAAVAFYALPPMISFAAATIAAFAPFILLGLAVAAAAAAFALLYDDVMNYIDGNDSLIGQILNAFPMIGDVIDWLVDVVVGLWDAVSWVFESILSILEISLEGWKLFFGLIYDGVASFVQSSGVMQHVIGAITGAFSDMGSAIGMVWDYLGDKVNAFIELIRTMIGFVKSTAGMISGTLASIKSGLGIDVTTNVKKSPVGLEEGRSSLALAATSPIGAQTSNSLSNSAKTSNRSTSVQVGKVEVHTQATDAQGIAGAIGDGLGTQIKQTAGQFDDGVLA